jgi:hypothetical protein
MWLLVPVIEWLALRPGSWEMWLSTETSSAELKDDLVSSGATRAARTVHRPLFGRPGGIGGPRFSL